MGMSAPTNSTATDVKAPAPTQSVPGSPAYEAEIKHWLEYDTSGSDRLFRLLMEPLLTFGYRQRAYGIENIPATGAFLMAANHSSYMDPFFYARPQGRFLRFMAKSTLMDMPVVGAVTRAGGGFPVRRGKGDAFAMDLAERLLDDGQPVCIFPEGTRYRQSSALGPSKSGAAILAIKTGLPVIPAATWGSKPPATRSERAFPLRLPKLTTLYGPPLQFANVEPSRAEITRVRDEIWTEVHRLHALAEQLHETRPRTFVVPSSSPKM